MKAILKEKAVNLRRKGYSYHEIMAKIPVAKSTLAEWLRSVGLSKQQKQRLTEKKLASAKRGAETRHRQRIIFSQKIIETAKKEIGPISKRELWLIGTMLYWAEGSKEKDYRPGSRAAFTNSDPDMITIFLCWLRQICGKTLKDITFDLSIHELQKNRTAEIVGFWSKELKCPRTYFRHIYYKRGSLNTKQKNIDASYHGILKIIVKSSSLLTRQIAGWTDGVVKSLR